MRYQPVWLLLLLTGCIPTQLLPEDPPTQQVGGSPFADARAQPPLRVNYPPASQETSYRVELIRGRLVGENPQIGLRPYVTAIGSGDPEVFHIGPNVYITEGLVKQCQTEGQLAGVIANELGRMISERESIISDHIRQPERPLPIDLPIGGTSFNRDRNPLREVELGRYEQRYPKQSKKLERPNPEHVARTILERAGYERTELDAAIPLLQNADRYAAVQNQFKGAVKQSEWKAP